MMRLGLAQRSSESGSNDGQEGSWLVSGAVGKHQADRCYSDTAREECEVD